MATLDTTWYIGSAGYTAVTAWATGISKSVGNLVRQLTAPTINNERVFVCVVAGTTHATTEPTWVLTRGAKTTDNTVTWQEVTGCAAMNGDTTNTTPWLSIKNTAVSLGQVIKNGAATYYFICTTAGTAGNGAEPSWTLTAGVTTADNTVTWTCLGAVGGFSGWGAPHARMIPAVTATWGAVGNTFFVASTHAETAAANTTVTWPGSANWANPNYVYCVSTGTVPPTAASITTGASISVTSTFQLFINGGSTEFYGIFFNQNSNQTFNAGGNSGITHFYNCSFYCGTGAFYFGNNAMRVVFDNCTVQFGAVGSNASIGSDFIWRNTASAIAGATFPTTMFTFLQSSQVLLDGVDLSALGAGKTIFNFPVNYPQHAVMKNCKLGASVTISNNSGVGAGSDLTLIDCDSGATNYKNYKYAPNGTLSTETTVVRTGGATDGTTPASWKIVTTANCLWANPFECMPIAIWNATTGATVNVTVYGIWGGGAVPNNDDIWIEVTYQGSAGSPISTLAKVTKANMLAANAAQSTDASAWGGSTTAFAMNVALDNTTYAQPQLAGPIYVTVKCAKPSTTFYIDPQVYLH